jgi:hypothetical protein
MSIMCMHCSLYENKHVGRMRVLPIETLENFKWHDTNYVM